MLRRMRMRARRILLALPLLLPSCGGGCIDIGIPNGVNIATEDYTAAPPEATVEVCAAGACGSGPIDAGQLFIDLPVDPDEAADITVTVRDATSREIARSNITARPTRATDEDACDTGEKGQVKLELDAAGQARTVER